MSLLVLSVSILGSRAVGLGKATGWFIYIYMYNMHIICIHVYTYIYIYMVIHPHKQTNIHTYIYIYIHTYVYPCIHMYIHVCMHAYIQTRYTHTHIHTCTDIPCIAMPLGDQLLFMLSALHTQVADKRICGWISGLRLSVMN